jgi:4-hydroxybenzoate polyprenyltransferase
MVCVPVFYYSLFRTVQSLARKLGKEVVLWSAVFLCANIAPFIYVLLFGQNIPWWVYVIIAILVGLGLLSLIMRLGRNPADDPNVKRKSDEE